MQTRTHGLQVLLWKIANIPAPALLVLEALVLFGALLLPIISKYN
jgi:hypothetical protein